MNAICKQIRQAAHELEDLLDSQFLSNIFSPTLPLELHSKEVCEKITSFVEAAKKMQRDYIQESNFKEEDDDDDDDDNDNDSAAVLSRSIGLSGAKMIGLSDEFTEIKDGLIRIKRPDDFCVISFLGSAGNGISLVAKNIYDEFIIGKEQCFDRSAWVRIGSTYSLKQILLTLIAQVISQPHDHESLVARREIRAVSVYKFEGKEIRGRVG